MKSGEGKNLLLLMTGSIAAYKVCTLISRAVQSGWTVQVVASPSALKFVGEATLEGLSGRPVLKDLYQSGEMMGHIHWMRWASVILVAPATANFINSAAAGVGRDLVETMFLAHDFKRPLIVAPAMNTSMYLHPTTQSSAQKLKEMGISLLETASGVLACGENGWGRLLDPELILTEVNQANSSVDSKVKGEPPQRDVREPSLRVLITAGGTREPIDQVRSIQNRSTGATGAFIADYACSLGLGVELLTHKAARRPTNDMPIAEFDTFLDFESALELKLKNNHYDFVIHSAAVSDFSVSKIENNLGATLERSGKIESDQGLKIEFKKNPKLISKIQGWSKNKNVKVIGFKLTSSPIEQDVQRAVEKVLQHPGVVAVVHNPYEVLEKTSHPFSIWDHSGKKSAGSTKEELVGNLFQNWVKS